MRGSRVKKLLRCSLGVIIALQMASAGYAATFPLQITDLLSMVRIPFQNGPRAGISPDGTKVFYGLEVPFRGDTVGSDFTHAGRKELLVEDLTDRSVVQLGDPKADNLEAVWS